MDACASGADHARAASLCSLLDAASGAMNGADVPVLTLHALAGFAWCSIAVSRHGCEAQLGVASGKQRAVQRAGSGRRED